MKDNFGDRKKRLEEFYFRGGVFGSSPGLRFPLLIEFPIYWPYFKEFELCAQMYLFSSLIAASSQSQLAISPVSIKHQLDILKSLPSITPNGSVVPKKESSLEFTMLHKSVVKIMRSLGIDDLIDLMHLPIVVRMVDGKPDPEKESRKYATTKLHTDVWNGEPPNALSIFLPVLGDIENTGVEFFEPNESLMKDWIKILPDYNAGAELLEHSIKYDFCWKKGYIYFVDPLLLHRTVKNAGGIRISIDFRLVPKEKLPSDEFSEDTGIRTNWKRNFISRDEWYKIGFERIIVPQDSMQETIEKYSQKNRERSSPIDYAERFKQIVLF